MSLESARARLQARYLENLARAQAELRALRLAGDHEQLRFAAHRIAGSGGSYGFPRLTELAKEVELASCEELAALVDQLIAHISEIRAR